MTFPIDRIRADVPMLGRTMHDRPLVYLDTAATALKPQQVVDRLVRFYTHEYGTVRRGAYLLSNESTAMYEGVRAQAAAFFGAADPSEVVFVRGVTEAINLFANAWGRANLKPGDRVVVSQMEHHANIVPWQLVCAATGAELVPAPIDDRGCIELDGLQALLDERTKVVSIVHVSNGLGTVNPVADIARMAHDVGALMVVDGAQSAPHLPVDV
ncbi:MAG: aminotransferase class V-fold PLP-dependent enzyme, partial [Myxococcales bacterium]|nr:aminotransferase class V-fold PLP-dependent enzyme [Myxococcales bacterium]